MESGAPAAAMQRCGVGDPLPTTGTMSLRRVSALLALSLVAPASAAAAPDASGGATAPERSGGVDAGQPFPTMRPRAAEFAVSPAQVPSSGGDVTVSFRIAARARTVRARVLLTAPGARRAAAGLRLGAVRAGRRHTRTWRLPGKRLEAGDYVVSLVAADGAGRSLHRTQAQPGRSALTVLAPPPEPTPAPEPPRVAADPDPAPVATPASVSGAGVFPVQGTWSFGGDGGRFAATRTGHSHQGQDIVAADGTPVVAPKAGVVSVVAYQPSGAGHYVVLHAGDGRDLVFMHLQEGSIPVAKGTAVTAGQLLGRVGATGTASGPHLHFELWPDGWWSSPTSRPIDPLPELQAWSATR
jgi:murein DD-endopeptidase MepM/ murein hydrolase activator NlpD